MTTLRNILGRAALALAATFSALPLSAHAGEWPSKPIILVAPFTPGGTTDLLARNIAQALGKVLNHAVIVDNRPGAGGTLGAGTVARAPADGYTLLLTNVGHTAAGALYKKLPYDFERDFTHLALVAKVPNILVVNKAFPSKTAAEFLAYLKANPGKVYYGSAGVGTTQHLAAELLRNVAKLDVTHVPYKGAAPMMTDLIAGQVHFALDSAGSAATYIRSDRVRALAVTSDSRDASFPDLPTLTESGLQGYVASTWYGVSAPANLPEPIKTRLHQAILKAYEDPQLVAAYKTMGAQADTRSLPEVAAYVREETVRWSRLVKSAGISAD
jgi:tripartite-type tricarboxylate transporter receptor subunit TctC